ncbi:MAG: PilZ domain-containing protein [Candidatus Magnetomorum sp.]|nr:PilZ domain-containing protein [Candidatus Magnetomorum sp.]
MNENNEQNGHQLRQILFRHIDDMSDRERSDLLTYIETKKNSETSTLPEKRNFTRHDCNLPVKITCCHKNERVDPVPSDGIIQNMSLGGVLLLTDSDFYIGDTIEMVFQLPDNTCPIEATGIVVRKILSGIGIRFDAFDIHTGFAGSIFCYIKQGLDVRENNEFV